MSMSALRHHRHIIIHVVTVGLKLDGSIGPSIVVDIIIIIKPHDRYVVKDKSQKKDDVPVFSAYTILFDVLSLKG